MTGGGPGWVRERDVLDVLAAVERELALSITDPRPLATSRLVRLRLLVLAVPHTDVPLPDALASLVVALREPPPSLA